MCKWTMAVVSWLGLSCWFPVSGAEGKLVINERDFGKTPEGTVVKQFTLQNSSGTVVKVITYGAIITEIRVPDQNGNFANVLLGSVTLDAYLKGHPASAAVIGRFANRIARARFTLNGKEYRLAENSGQNHIHGGNRNFSRVVWNAEASGSDSRRAWVRFVYVSKDGEESYPGNLKVQVTYALTEKNEVEIEYGASTDQDTVVNLTNHAYFNLAGAGDCLEHELWLSAKEFTPADDQLIPTGEIASVKGTPLDFTKPRKIGDRIEQLKPRPGGYDHNYVLGKPGELKRFARVRETRSGRVMEVSTTEPGVQLYTGNHIRNFTGTDNAVFGRHGGFCLETQHYPDSPNKPQFPSTVLKAGETFKSRTILAFSAGETARPDKLTSEAKPDRVLILAGEKPFTEYLCLTNAKYPYFYPVNGPASGRSVTIHKTEPYPHHSSLFFGCDRVSGGNYWQEGLERGRIVSRALRIVEPGGERVVIEQECDWERPGAPSPFKDQRRITISAPSPAVRYIDFEVTLIAQTKVRVEKNNHSLFAVRVAPELSVKGGGTLVNAAGDKDEKGTFGKPSAWAQFYGTREGQVEGIAILNHPSNRWSPPPWFTRDYGFLSPTPMNWLEKGFVEFASGEKVRLRYRTIVYAEERDSAWFAAEYEQWSKGVQADKSVAK